MFESARWVTDFSALKAARAFEAIEKYAANLINQPWRKEFEEIKVSLVYYKNQLKSVKCRESQYMINDHKRKMYYRWELLKV